jgi:ketosteroid isomerase-like protein
MMALETGKETDMAEHPNLLLMRRALDAFRSGDVPTLAQVFASDVVWRVPGRSALAKDYKGQDEVFGFFGRLMELTSGTFRVESLDMFANDRGGVFVDRLSAAREGKALDVRLLLHVSIQNGQIAEGVDHFHPEHMWDEFWS